MKATRTSRPAKSSRGAPSTGKSAAEIAKLLVEFGRRTEFAGENRYKARAYYRAAEALQSLTEPLASLIQTGRLREIPGVGASIGELIETLYRTGTHPRLETLRARLPSGVLDLLRVPGLRPEKALAIHRALDVSSLEELEQACRLKRLAEAKGLGPALERKILQGLDIMRRGAGLRHLHRAAELLATAKRNLARSHPELTRIVPAGDFRRGCELIGDLRLVAQSRNTSGNSHELALGDGLIVSIAPAETYGLALLFATGAPEHLRDLQAFARERGVALSPDELVQSGGGHIACREETHVYTALGLPFIAPELREGSGEVALAAAGRLPVLVQDTDLRGLLHCHTDFSDGGHTLAQMAEATRKRGYTYFGVADHSQAAGYAGGMKLDAVAEQHALADDLNRSYRGTFRIFKGIECDILADGTLDYDEETLDRFDFVVASVHSRFALPRVEQTARLLRAVENPHTTMLGHMTGRQLLRREGYDIDIDAVLRACAAHGVVVEINANPYRLDLDWRWHQRALESGCMVSINPDAHSIAELDLTHFGVLMARKGGVPAERVLNCLDASTLGEYFAERKRGTTRKGVRTRPEPTAGLAASARRRPRANR